MKRNLPIICYFGFIILVGVSLTQTISIKRQESQKISNEQIKAIEFCDSLFKDGILSPDSDERDLEICETELIKTEAIKGEKEFVADIQFAKEYLAIQDTIDNSLIDNPELTAQAIANINAHIKRLPSGYREKLNEQITPLNAELQEEKSAEKDVLELYTDDNLNTREDINREGLEHVKTIVANLKSERFKNQLNSTLTNAENTVLEKERIERERQEQLERERQEAIRRRQQEIANAWHTFTVPYISQNRNGVYNGCEASSVLMALQYRGYLTSKNLYDYATEIPKADNPNDGFYLDIYGLEPRNESHWIAPAPLIEFAKNSSGYENIYDLTGSDLETLKNEILANNPVVIYLTYDFKNPSNYSFGVPKNLHVMLLTGYNTITNEYQITDPWTRNNGQYIFYLSGDRVQSLYEQVGRRSVVIR